MYNKELTSIHAFQLTIYLSHVGHVKVVCLVVDPAVSHIPQHFRGNACDCAWIHSISGFLAQIYTSCTESRSSLPRDISIQLRKKKLRWYFTESCGCVEWHFVENHKNIMQQWPWKKLAAGCAVRTWWGLRSFEITARQRLIPQDKWMI